MNITWHYSPKTLITMSNNIFSNLFRSASVMIAGLAMVLSISGCHKAPVSGDNNPVTLDQIVVSPTFNWATTHNVDISISAKDNLDTPIEGVRFTVYTANPDSGGVYLTSGITGADGMLKAIASLSTDMNKVTVFNNFLGLIRQMEVPVTSEGIVAAFGGKSPPPVAMKSASDHHILSPNTVKWVYMSSYNSQGVPNNLMPSNDPVSQTLLHDINVALPEYKNEVAAHPEWFTQSVTNNLDIIASSDVYITYITEGAGWTNSIAYFTYNTNQPPATAAQIDTIHVMFPNASNTGSGGGLNPGNKIFLGHFNAGKSIGLVVVPHGWNGNGTNPGSDVWYSIPSFNTTDPLMLKHLLLFKDPSRQQILFSFEDQGKYQGADLDCNDGIFYITVNPLSAVNTTNMPVLATTVIDSDHDGIPDNSDDYPNDGNKAFNNYTPSKTGFSSLVFEDLWPGKGDYDFNDLVTSYRFNMITNAQNQVVEIDATIIPEAIGASYHNGLAFQLPFAPSKIQNVTGSSLNHGYITLSANKTEAGQSKAVVIAFDDAFDKLRPSGSGFTGSNTVTTAPYVTPDTVKLVITMATPITLAQAGTAPFNPFIMVNGVRSHEVHLPDYAPTDKMDLSLFGTANDDSKPAQGRYYKTANNLPWGLNIVEKFTYPIEKAAINTGYSEFTSWAESAGATYPNWYKNLGGYRVVSKLYSH